MAASSAGTAVVSGFVRYLNCTIVCRSALTQACLLNSTCFKEAMAGWGLGAADTFDTGTPLPSKPPLQQPPLQPPPPPSKPPPSKPPLQQPAAPNTYQRPLPSSSPPPPPRSSSSHRGLAGLAVVLASAALVLVVVIRRRRRRRQRRLLKAAARGVFAGGKLSSSGGKSSSGGEPEAEADEENRRPLPVPVPVCSLLLLQEEEAPAGSHALGRDVGSSGSSGESTAAAALPDEPAAAAAAAVGRVVGRTTCAAAASTFPAAATSAAPANWRPKPAPASASADDAGSGPPGPQGHLPPAAEAAAAAAVAAGIATSDTLLVSNHLGGSLDQPTATAAVNTVDALDPASSEQQQQQQGGGNGGVQPCLASRRESQAGGGGGGGGRCCSVSGSGHSPSTAPSTDALTAGTAASGDAPRLLEAVDAVITPTTPPDESINMHMVLGRDVVIIEGAVRGTGAFGTVVEGVLITRDGGQQQQQQQQQDQNQDQQQNRTPPPAGGVGGGRQRVAVKLLRNLQAACPSEQEMESLRKEVEVLSRCRHPNIVRLLGGSLSPPLETCSWPEGAEGPSGRREVPLEQVLRIGRDVALGLAYLHPTVVHRDLKPGNVLLDEQGNAKLSDFGLARLTATTLRNTTTEVGSVPYMAPECFGATSHGVSHRTDIFALGVLLWEMLARARPWSRELHIKVALAVSIRGERPPLAAIRDRAPPRLCQLVEECWQEDPYRRPAALDIAKRLTVMQQQQMQMQQQAQQQQRASPLPLPPPQPPGAPPLAPVATAAKGTGPGSTRQRPGCGGGADRSPATRLPPTPMRSLEPVLEASLERVLAPASAQLDSEQLRNHSVGEPAPLQEPLPEPPVRLRIPATSADVAGAGNGAVAAPEESADDSDGSTQPTFPQSPRLLPQPPQQQQQPADRDAAGLVRKASGPLGRPGPGRPGGAPEGMGEGGGGGAQDSGCSSAAASSSSGAGLGGMELVRAAWARRQRDGWTRPQLGAAAGQAAATPSSLAPPAADA
ncbi:hypothetical protein PLESTM_001278300 [Pleodorina starrii]|nr:hypothetical protein PLESTM_001278300 [Pleodorina starrii]